MSRIVIDTSVTTVWLVDDESDPLADRAMERLLQDGAFVPQLWHLEIRNALLYAERRGRIPANGVEERLDDLQGLPIQTDEELDLGRALALARAHGLTMYDAVYLELAERKGAELATLDRALARAAAAEGVAVTPA